jgi:asparagine synthase (glutamine-hydrolysing)
MCGIAGIISPDKSADSLQAESKAMIETLYHRGPDSRGVWVSEPNGLAIAHRRLSIQDLSDSGNQPMFSHSSRYGIVFNGEIYNFREISADLKGRGHHFRGGSDTEVLLAAVDEWGLDAAVKRFSGMFAFALWDCDERTLYLCRDRLGEKPLYYGWLGSTFYFASELKAIERVAPVGSLEIDRSGLLGYFRHGYISAPHSIYRGIYKLPPGTTLVLPVKTQTRSVQFSPWPDSSSGGPKRYWSVFDAAQQGFSSLITDETEAASALEELLHLTIRRQMIADVKLGMFLSGGIDSTLVSAIAQNEASEKVRTFTIGFSDAEYDESGYAEKIARHLGTEHLSVQVTPQDGLQLIPYLAAIYDEPFADSSQIPAYLVSKIAREHVTVCLSGDGGDELFAGYNRYMWLDRIWTNVGPVPWPIRKVIGRMLSFPSTDFWDRFYGGISAIGSGPREKQKLVGLKLQKLAGLIQEKDLMRGYDYLLSYWHNPEELVSIRSDEFHKNPKTMLPEFSSFIDTAMYLDQVGYLPGDNLSKVDRASMSVSLETRLPLLSHEVLEFSWRIPVSMKVRKQTSKWILRQVLGKYVPPGLIERPKMGFSVPIAQWLRGELKEWAADLLATVKPGGCEIIREEPVRTAWKEHQSGKRDNSHRLWTVLMFLSWASTRM